MWLLVRSGPDEGAAVPVTGEAFVLGRQRGCDLVVRDARASRRHLELRPAAGGAVRLRDLGSANGTFVDGRPMREAVLEGGEEIRIGDVRIDVVRGAPPGGERRPAAERADGVADAGAATQEPAAVPTYSGVQRLVEHSARRARHAALLAAGVAVAAVLVAGLVVLGDGGREERVPDVVAGLAPATTLVITERDGVRTATGSGWVLDAREGLVVTNAHVVNEGATVTVATEGRVRRATVRAAAPCADLALLELDDPTGLHAARPAASGSVEPGETVVALGYGADAQPGDEVSSTTGVVSLAATEFRDPAPDVPAYTAVIQTDTALNPGNSGGPLADLDGRVIGINSAARSRGSDGRALQNVNYAIAMEAARPVLETLRTGNGIAWTGLTFGYPTDDELAAEGLPPGLRITGETREGAAEGIAPGTLLVAVDGRPISNTLASFCEVAGALRAGSEVALDLLAPGDRRARRVTVPLL